MKIQKDLREYTLLKALEDKSVCTYGDLMKKLNISMGTARAWVLDCDEALRLMSKNKAEKQRKQYKALVDKVERIAREKCLPVTLAAAYARCDHNTYRKYKAML